MVTLACTVRDCSRPLSREGARLTCARGHSFDVARSGYVNLLQPGDSKAREPGDSKEVVAARGRFLERHGAPLLDLLADVTGAAARGADLLDVGCGEGFVLRGLRERVGAVGHGVDISVAALDAAARRDPFARFVVANADRKLPYVDASFAIVLSITSRRNGPELRRVLKDGGLLVLAVPAADDLAELREAVLGRAVLEERLERAVADVSERFELVERRVVRQVVRLDGDEIRDVLTMTYRGSRRSERERAAALDGLDVTLAQDLAVLRPRTDAGRVPPSRTGTDRPGSV